MSEVKKDRSALGPYYILSGFLRHLSPHAVTFIITAVIIAVTGARFSLINRCGSDVPWGDQWYGEVERTYKPWLQGNFHIAELFGTHNEHRIVATRLLDIAMLQANGHWDPRMQQVVNTVIILAALLVLLRHMAKYFPPQKLLIAAGLIIAFWGSDYFWENTLCGFQSPFYFLLLFSLIHVLQTVCARPFSKGWWFGHIAGLCNLFTMAAGLISACAVIGWLMWCRLRAKESAAGDSFTLIWNIIILALGCWLLPYSPTVGHIGSTLSVDRLQALLHCLSWPILKWQFGLLVWAPGFLYLGLAISRPSSRANQSWLVALVLLSLLFVLATVLARDGVPSRYGDIFALGILTNFLCLMTWLSYERLRWVIIILSILWLVLVLLGLRHQEKLAFEVTLQQENMRQRGRADTIRQYLLDGDAMPLRKNDQFSELDIGVLQTIQETPALREILPFSIRPPIEMQLHSSNEGFMIGGAPSLKNAVTALPVIGTWRPDGKTKTGSWMSQSLRANAALLTFFFAGDITPPYSEFYLQTKAGVPITPLQKTTASPNRWRQINFPNPGQSFQIVASVNGADHWLAFSAPREYARGSWLTTKVILLGSALYFTGWMLLAGVGGVILGEKSISKQKSG